MPEKKTALREAIRDLLAKRDAGKTICPSEAARAVAPDSWRELMPLCRTAAIELASEGEIEICQKGIPIDISAIKGPIRLRKR